MPGSLCLLQNLPLPPSLSKPGCELQASQRLLLTLTMPGNLCVLHLSARLPSIPKAQRFLQFAKVHRFLFFLTTEILDFDIADAVGFDDPGAKYLVIWVAFIGVLISLGESIH
jgi:hypothetical protein